MKHAAIAALTALVLLSGCCHDMRCCEEPVYDAELERLTGWLEGSFARPVTPDDAGDEPAVILVAERVEDDRPHENWLFLRHVGMPGAEAFDRYWRLRRVGEHRFALDPFVALPWSEAGGTAEEGCTVVLERLGDDTYSGGRNGAPCSMDEPGAEVVVQSMVVTPVEIRSWNRGFDAAGRRVSGTEGPVTVRKVR